MFGAGINYDLRSGTFAGQHVSGTANLHFLILEEAHVETFPHAMMLQVMPGNRKAGTTLGFGKIKSTGKVFR